MKYSQPIAEVEDRNGLAQVQFATSPHTTLRSSLQGFGLGVILETAFIKGDRTYVCINMHGTLNSYMNLYQQNSHSILQLVHPNRISGNGRRS